jgi:hypothetical protein
MEEPIDAIVVPHDGRQGCLRVAAVTAARLSVHFLILVVIFAVLVQPIRVFDEFYQQENLKIPGPTVQLIYMSRRMNSHFFVIVPGLLLIDALVLVALQSLRRPWRLLARIWFAMVLFVAFLWAAFALFCMAVPIDARFPPDARIILPDAPAEPNPNAEK